MKKPTISVLSALVGAAVGAGAVEMTSHENAEKLHAMSEKHLALFLMMNQWVKVKQEGKNLSSYFERKGYKKIAVYGMSYAGATLLNELRNSETSIEYGIDRNADSFYTDIDIVSVNDDLRQVDAVVVTPITFFDEIEEELSQKLSCPILSLEDILHEV